MSAVAPPNPSDPPLRGRRREPAIAVDVSRTTVRAPLSHAVVRRLASYVLARQGVRQALISFTFVSNREIATLNRRILGHRGSTDIVTLAFRRLGDELPVVGDVYIAPDVVRRNAADVGVPVREEAARVIVHGVLHSLGMDHPEVDRERSPLWKRQERLLASAKREGLW